MTHDLRKFLRFKLFTVDEKPGKGSLSFSYFSWVWDNGITMMETEDDMHEY